MRCDVCCAMYSRYVCGVRMLFVYSVSVYIHTFTIHLMYFARLFYVVLYVAVCYVTSLENMQTERARHTVDSARRFTENVYVAVCCRRMFMRLVGFQHVSCAYRVRNVFRVDFVRPNRSVAVR